MQDEIRASPEGGAFDLPFGRIRDKDVSSQLSIPVYVYTLRGVHKYAIMIPGEPHPDLCSFLKK